MAKHAAPAAPGDVLDGISREWVLTRATALIGEMEAYQELPVDDRLRAIATGDFCLNDWAGRTVEIMKELTRDA